MSMCSTQRGTLINPILEDLEPSPLEIKPDGGFRPAPPQEPPKLNGAGLSKKVRDKNVEDDFQFLVGPVKRVGQLQKQSVQPGPTEKLDLDARGCGRQIGVEYDLSDPNRGHGSENLLDRVIRPPETGETESHFL